MTREGMAELWISRVNDYRASGERVATWCERHQVTLHQPFYWMRKLRTMTWAAVAAESIEHVLQNKGARTPGVDGTTKADYESPEARLRWRKERSRVAPWWMLFGHGFPELRDLAALDRLLPWSESLPPACRLPQS